MSALCFSNGKTAVVRDLPTLRNLASRGIAEAVANVARFNGLRLGLRRISPSILKFLSSKMGVSENQGVPYLPVLIIRILLFRGAILGVPYFRKLPKPFREPL